MPRTGAKAERRILMKISIRVMFVIWLLVALFATFGCKKSDDKTTTCDLGEPDQCEENEICAMPAGEEEFICVEPCDPEASDACPDKLTCDGIDTGGFACFYPLIISGNVFDALSLAGIEGAQVTAANEAGLVVTDVAETDNEGFYELAVPVTRDATGVPLPVTVNLRVSAQDYYPYPHGLRPSIPVDMQSPLFEEDSHYSVENLTTDVALFELEEHEGFGIVSGDIEGENPKGALIVAEGGSNVPAPYTFADQNGSFTLFNVPPGVYQLRAYKAGLQVSPADVEIGESETVSDVTLASSEEPLGSVSGTINIVNAPGGSATSVVLIPESTFMETFTRGVVPPGLRAPSPGTPPSITSNFQINEVPDGDFVVLAAFENDGLVRDPDPGIAGTQIVHISIPDNEGEKDITMETAFKITEAIEIMEPGAGEPEAVDPAEPLTFICADDSSETHYSIVLYNVFGELVWEDQNVPSVQGPETVEVLYDGPALEDGMYYQWKATSHRMSGPISRTEDLKGVFFVPSTVD